MKPTKKSGKGRNTKGAGKRTVAGTRPVKHATTRRGKAEDALKEDAEKYKFLVEATQTGFVILDEQGRVLDANEEYVKLTGHGSLAEIAGRAVTEWTAAYDLERNAAEVRKCMESGSVRNLVVDYVGPTRRVTPVEINATVLRDPQAPRIFTVCRDITERKRVEEALRESETTYRGIIDSFSEAVYIQDENGTFIDVNKGAEKMYGYTRDEFIGMSPATVSAEGRNDLGRVAELFRLAFDGEHQFFEFWGAAKNGRIFPKEVHLYPNRYFGRKTVVAIAQDITERKRAEDALRKSERMLQAIIDAEPDCIKVVDEESRLIMMNRAGLNMIQADSLDQVIGHFVCPLVAPEYQQAFMDLTGRVFQGGTGSLEFQMTGMRGRQLWLETYAVPLRDEKDTIVAMLGVTRDITERKASQHQLAVSRRMLRNVIDAIPVRVFWKDLDSKYLGCNKLFARDAGRPDPDSLLGEDDFSMGWAEQAEAYRADDLEVMRTGAQKINYEEPQTTPDGDRIWLRTSKMPLRDEDGTIYGVLGTYEDITERKRVEDALRESEERFRAITMTASDAILLMSDTGRIVYWNPAAERIFGYPAEEAIGRELHMFLAPERLHEDFHKGFARFVMTGQGPVINRSVEMIAMKKDGTEFPIEVSTSAMNIGGKWHALGIVRDITERKQLEEERLKTQKLESIGTLAGGIAHDFNNLLQGIFGYISMAKLTIDQKQKSLAMLEQAEKALHASVGLSNQLLTFSKGGKPVKKVVDLRPVIENAVKFSLSGSRVTYDLSHSDDLCAVEADEGQIGQVVQNIVLNAEQSMPLGGRIEIAARNVPATDAVGLPLSAPDGIVEIVVRDRGIGIPTEHLVRIFDPYFTTKEKGSGLGLATSYSIVKNHDGLIDVSSVPGKGSTFTVYLPATRAAQAPAASSASAVRTEGRKGNLLVMDDEEIVRIVAGELLRELGHEVEFAEHGDSALEKYKQAKAEGRPFDVVILDLTIRGGMGGLETIGKLKVLDPGVTAVVSSGYSDDEVVATYRQHGFRAFLKKPYDMRELARVLSEVMA